MNMNTINRCNCPICDSLYCYNTMLKIDMACGQCTGFNVRNSENCQYKNSNPHNKICDDCKAKDLDIPQSN